MCPLYHTYISISFLLSVLSLSLSVSPFIFCLLFLTLPMHIEVCLHAVQLCHPYHFPLSLRQPGESCGSCCPGFFPLTKKLLISNKSSNVCSAFCIMKLTSHFPLPLFSHNKPCQEIATDLSLVLISVFTWTLLLVSTCLFCLTQHCPRSVEDKEMRGSTLRNQLNFLIMTLKIKFKISYFT